MDLYAPTERHNQRAQLQLLLRRSLAFSEHLQFVHLSAVSRIPHTLWHRYMHSSSVMQRLLCRTISNSGIDEMMNCVPLNNGRDSNKIWIGFDKSFECLSMNWPFWLCHCCLMCICRASSRKIKSQYRHRQSVGDCNRWFDCWYSIPLTVLVPDGFGVNRGYFCEPPPEAYDTCKYFWHFDDVKARILCISCMCETDVEQSWRPIWRSRIFHIRGRMKETNTIFRPVSSWSDPALTWCLRKKKNAFTILQFPRNGSKVH